MRKKGAALIAGAIMLGICMIACGEQNELPSNTNPEVTATVAPVQPDNSQGGNQGTSEIIYVTATPTPFATPMPAAHAEQQVSFSIDNNFVTETTELVLSAKGAKAIYYTTDGKIPDETAQVYHSPITIRAGKSVEANGVRVTVPTESGASGFTTFA